MTPASSILRRFLLVIGLCLVPSTRAADLPVQTDASIREVILRVARRQIQPLDDSDYPQLESLENFRAIMQPKGIAWNYPWGVTLYGLLRASDATGDPEIGRFVLRHNEMVARDYVWLEGLRTRFAASGQSLRALTNGPMGRILALGSLDNCGAMGAQFLETFMRQTNGMTATQRQVGALIADYITTKQARLPDGTLWRPERYGGTIWADDLYMSCPFLARWSQVTGDRRYLDDAARQIINMAARLQDKDGLWFHAYYPNEQKPAAFKWGRANGWAMVAMVEVLSAMPVDHPDRPKLLDLLKRQAEGAKAVQAPSGMWRQVLDQPECWEETSVTAMFTYALARAANRGWIDASNLAVARRAFAGICQHVTPEGMVKDTCAGTSIGANLDFYLTRPHPDDDPHGRGPVMLAGAELLLAGKGVK